MGNLLTQSLKILGQATVQQGKDYMSNAVDLVNDANEIRNDVMKVAKNSVDTLKNMKRNFNFRKIHDWFYQKESEYDDAGDEYDPGFDTGDAEEDNQSTILDRDAMNKISDRQSNMMIQIGARQAETTMASTAEIVTTINQRSSEILSSVNNINSTLLGISKKLDAFASVVQAEKTEQARQSLYDSNGRLSLQSIYQAAKNGNGVLSTAGTYGSLLPMLAQGGPAGVLQLLYGFSGIGDKNLKVLGGRSINDTMDTINDTIGEAVQRGLEDLISSKTFKTLFGDLKRGEINYNYQNDVIKGYNNKQATFDGYVRTTIIRTIPEYLRIIAKGVTGINYNVDHRGELSEGTSVLNERKLNRWRDDEAMNRSQHQQEMLGHIGTDAFKSNGLSYTGINDVYENRADKNLTKTEIRVIVNSLNGAFVYYLRGKRTNTITPSMFEDSTLINNVVAFTVKVMSRSSNKNIDWEPSIRGILNNIIMDQSQLRNFCTSINNSYREQHAQYVNAASNSSPQAILSSAITEDMALHSGISQGSATLEKADKLERFYELKEKLAGMNKRNWRQRLSDFSDSRLTMLEEFQELADLLGLDAEGNGNTYNQTRYGNYLNMSRRGCGPVALADMLNRRGLYNPMTGMNVRNYMKASAMMGQPLTPGAVNNMSLRHASGNNPITLLGSGPEFGTAYGNNHFVNVIGTDGGGNVYVMNPLDGRVHKRSINNVSSASLVGLYGSGLTGTVSNGFNALVTRTGSDLYDSAKSRVSSFISNRLPQVSGFIDDSLQRSLYQAQHYGESAGVSEEDRTQMNLVLSMMETSAEDGDSGPDRQSIMMEISKIKDQKLKARLRAAVGGMIDRSEKKKESGGILSKLFSAGKGMLKNFFAPLIAGVTSVIKGVVSGAKKFLSPVIKYFKEQLKKNLGKIGTGAKQVWQGTKQLFSRSDGTPRQPGRIRSFFSGLGSSSVATPAVTGGEVIQTSGTPGVMDTIEVPQNATMPVVPTTTTAGAMMPSLDGTTPTGTAAATGASTVATTTGGKLDGIKKILGGMGGIVAGMAGILFNIFMGVTGFKALFKTVTTVVKSIAKSFNGLFKSLNKTLKPVLKILTKSLTEIVKSVTNIIGPVLESMQPVLTTIGEVIANCLTPLEPLLSFIGKIVGKIATYALEPIQYMAEGIKFLTTKFAKAFGFIMHPFSRKKRAQYYRTVGLNDDGLDENADVENTAKKAGAVASMGLNPGVYIGMKLGSGLVQGDGTTKTAEVKEEAALGKTAAEKDTNANSIAKRMYPNDSTKQQEIYDSLMSGKLSVTEAEKMIRRKALLGESTVSNKPIDPQLAKEGVSSTGQALIKYFKGRDATVDAENKRLEKKQDEQYKENQEMQKSIFKNGPMKILSNIRSMSDALSFFKGSGSLLTGTLTSGVGGIIGGLGKVLTGIGEGFSFLPWVGDDNAIKQLGETMSSKADQMITDGSSMMSQGYNIMKNVSSSDVPVTNDTSSALKSMNSLTIASSSKASKTSTGSTNRAVNGWTYTSAGDIPFSNASVDMIGSGDMQSSFGSYLNMARRGCGPVALADAYNRRTGSNINARNLAANMTANGTYNPASGTSVAGYINAANAMGMRTRVGGVTMNSLKRATPNNPITLIGSGTEFGTRNGNNHYLNAIGTDHYGGVYVSNPMTGRIHRRSANSLAGSSLMGIYGSGDLTDAFSDATKEAMSNLVSLGSAFASLFNFDEGDIDDIATNQETADNEAKIANSARDNYSEDEYQEKVLLAMNAFKGDNPIHDGESLEDYEKRISNEWNNSKTTQNKYIAMVSQAALNADVAKKYSTLLTNSSNYYEPYVEYQRDAAGNIVHDENGNPIITGGFKYTLENENSDYVKAKKANIAIKKLGEAIQMASSMGGSSGGATGGSSGSRSGNTSDLYEAAAQVWEAAGNKLGALYSYDNRGPITTRSGVTLNELHPDCSGMISAAMNYMGYTFKGTMNGSRNRWTTHDITGKTSNDLIYNSDGSLSADWEFIPYSPSKLRPGDILTTPSHVGLYIRGNEPNAYGYDAGNGTRLPQLAKGAAKAYLDRDANWQNYLQWTMGPGYSGDGGTPTTILRYIGGTALGSSLEDGESSGGTSSGGSGQGHVALSKAMKNATAQWKYYPDKLTKAGYWDQAKRAGLTTAQTAMVAAIGIHENGAKKLTGEESLTRVVWDNIGKQYAFGLMNWIPDAKNSRTGANETKFGTTLADQLKYIRASYFDPNSTYDRAKNINFNRYYGNAMKEALGYAPKLGQGDRWGPYAETDIAEAMGHYVGNALVPYDFNRTTGQARHMRTAVEAYNYMLDNGLTNGYATGNGGQINSGGASVAGFDLTSMLGDYVNDLPDYYKTMLNTVQSSINATAAAANAAYSDSYDDWGDYDYDDDELGDAEALTGDTRVYATDSERKTLYTTMKKKHTGSTAWSNSQLTSKGYGDVYLYLDTSTSSKITCKLKNNAKYTKVTTGGGNWYFVYTGSGYLCGWGQASDFALTSDVKNKSYQTNTSNQVNSASDAMYAKWKGTSDSMMFYNPGDLQADADKKFWSANKRNHWYNSKNGVQSDINKYWKYEVKNSRRTKVADPYVMLNTSYDKSHVNVYQPFLLSKLKSKTLGQLKNTPGACGDFDFGTTDSGFYIPGNILGSGEDSINPIPPLDNNAFDALMNYGYDSDGSYTVNNYTIQGGINSATADLSRADLLNYLIQAEFTTRSPRTEKLLKQILDKLNGINSNQTTSTDTSNMYEDEIPEVISALARG